MTITGASFIVLVLVALLVLYRLDHNKSKFRVVQFVSNPDGTADKWSLVFIGAFLVSSWGLWQLIDQKALTEWYWNGYLYAFVISALGNKAIRAWQGIMAGTSFTRRPDDAHRPDGERRPDADAKPPGPDSK